MGTFAIEAIDTVRPFEYDQRVYDIGRGVMRLIADIALVIAERDSNNDAAEEISPDLPHQLESMKDQDLSSSLNSQKNRLKEMRTKQEIERIELNFPGLVVAYKSEKLLRGALDVCDGSKSFEKG